MRSQWTLPDDVTYLNHGSFGPAPRAVQQARRDWSARLESQPMDFFVRQMEHHLDEAADRLGAFIGAARNDLIFVDNATYGMNIVARSLPLQPGDEVLLTDHEYGAVQRIWQIRCREAAAKAVTARLPFPLQTREEIVAATFAAVTQNTKLIVLSHVTSPTGVILPAEEICREARRRNIPVCIDGPHALAMLPLNLKKLGCDFYAASGHKWLSAPFGSGFLYVAPAHRKRLKSPIISWGGSLSGRPKHWKDEFTWSGTRDPAPFLSIPAAIDFLETFGVEKFRSQTHALARYARKQITPLTSRETFLPDTPDWYASMIALPLPPANEPPPQHGRPDPLQSALWERFKIEVPVMHWQEHRLLRVSCHLYNDEADINRLVNALHALLD